MSIDREGIGMTSRRTRERMVARLRAQGILNPKVLAVMAEVPRHLFVAEALASRAYEDTALPIGFGQTLSQPYTVARLVELAIGQRRPEKVLEIGTGSGYLTAILAQLAGMVYTVERHAVLQKTARFRLYDLKIYNVKYKCGDGNLGWLEHAPYDAVVVTAAAEEVPEPLLKQLKVSGRLVVPVGQAAEQILKRFTRTDKGYESEDVGRVRFVPLLGGREDV